jgi:RimJ/RimL family protein N-acetyltransferase
VNARAVALPTALETARLCLERIGLQHLDEIQRMHEDARVMATLGGVRDRKTSEEMLRRWAGHWDAHGFGLWAAFDKEAGRFAGRGGLRRVEVGGREEVEVGYGFLAPFWGRGLATELATRSLELGFTLMELPDAVSFTLTSSRASQHVMEKAGLRYERDVVYADLPHVLYRIRAEDWRRGR